MRLHCDRNDCLNYSCGYCSKKHNLKLSLGADGNCLNYKKNSSPNRATAYKMRRVAIDNKFLPIGNRK